MDLNEIWRNCLGELEVSISRPNFVTWFKNTFIIDFKKGVFTIGVPTFFVEDWLKKKHVVDIQKALSRQVKAEVTGIKFKIANPAPEQVITFSNDKVIHKPVEKSPSESAPSMKSQTLPKNTTLNDYYTFSNFVVGTSNQLAYAAAEAVAKNIGKVYNPLFIYGESGLGKTHIMQAIGNYVLEKDPKANILYVSSETFINDFIGAVEIGAGRAKDFKGRYRNVDILLIDDIQFLSGKEQTQDEFFHTFNHLHQNNKQVVLTADRFPKAIRGLEKRLQTRFEGGMVADIGQPDLETRVAILSQKARVKGKDIDTEILYYIAENVKSSIRELEGALIKVIATCDLKQCAPTRDLVAEVLGGIMETARTQISPDVIVRETCKYFKLAKEDLLGQKRNREIVVPRQIVMYLLRVELAMSYPEIGKEMGGKDHTTIMHGSGKIEAEINTNSKLKEDIGLIREKVRQAMG